MKKILFLGSLRSGGAEHQMVVVASILKKEGYDVTYLCSEESSFFKKDLDEADIPIVRITNNKLASFLKLSIPRSAFIVYKTLKKEKYDTVVSFLGDWNFYNCITAKFKKTQHRVITAIRNNRDEVFLWRREKFYYRYERYTYRKVSNSEAAKNKFAQYYPELASKLMTIYNIVDLPPIVSSYTCKRDNRVNIIVPASYREVKNPMRLLEAITLMPIVDRNNIKIDWYGDIKSGQSLYNKMVDYIKANELENVVVLHDATNDIANRVNEADMIGLFSTSEGLPNSICEGMMLGKPVIMTKVSDFGVLVDKTNGFLCDSADTQSIKEALCAAAKCTVQDLVDMGNNSKQKALKLFSKETIIEQWKQII